MDHEPGRLVDDDYVGIFEDNHQGNRLRLWRRRADRGHEDAEGFAPPDPIGWREPGLVVAGDRNLTTLDQGLDASPRQRRKRLGEQSVQPGPPLVRGDRNGICGSGGHGTSGAGADKTVPGRTGPRASLVFSTGRERCGHSRLW